MASKFFERRSFRNQLKTYLEARGWTGLTWAEGFNKVALSTIEPPFVAVFLDDFGKEELEMGSNPAINKLFTRRAQVTVYMENEDRVSAITDDISDFMDIETIIIKDNNLTVLGSMISETESILTDIENPSLSEEQNLDWVGHVTCMYEVHYPNG